MDSRLLWVLVATIITVVFVDLSDGEEGVEEPGQTQDGHGEGSTATVRIVRTTQYQWRRWRPYRQKKAPSTRQEKLVPMDPPFPVHSGTPMPYPKADKESPESSLRQR
ncbi:hypothetical protein E2320_000073 [Naja naja]|nr:hypothetical protein E2320_000073 [Naja naja]